MHHYILQQRDLYGLPRKFNIAFDGGGRISALEDSNDIGFAAIRVEEGHGVPAGVYYRMGLGGITGHHDFTRDTGVLLEPDECVDVAAAVVRVFIEHGCRTDRNKARLKYLLDDWGFEKFMEHVERRLPKTLRRLALAHCSARPAVEKHGHIGIHPQKEQGKSYVGVIAPVGRLTVRQMHGVADISRRFGSGDLRLTVWQNLLIPDIADANLDAVRQRIAELGLSDSASSVRAGLVACTGKAGCKYAAAHTKQHALELADYLEARVSLDSPVNIHLTGCHHSCAQHFIGDIGMIATSVEKGEDLVEGYHIFVGGGYGAKQMIGRKLYGDVPAAELCQKIERMLRGYMAHRRDEKEPFDDFVRRHETAALHSLFEAEKVTL